MVALTTENPIDQQKLKKDERGEFRIMKGRLSLVLKIIALAFFMTGGISGGAQSQPSYDQSDYAPYYEPYFDPNFGSFYDSYYDPHFGAYDYDDELTDPELRAQIIRDHAVTPFINGDQMVPGAYNFDIELTDPELRAQIIRNLAISPFVDRGQINISVNNGVVTLSGKVEDRSAMIDAVEIAYDAGARKVRNRLRPGTINDRPWMDMSDRELKKEILDELSSSPFVNAGRISVNVRNGMATLHGEVENKGEIGDAVENAYEAGAKRVRSRLSAASD